MRVLWDGKQKLGSQHFNEATVRLGIIQDRACGTQRHTTGVKTPVQGPKPHMLTSKIGTVS